MWLCRNFSGPTKSGGEKQSIKPNLTGYSRGPRSSVPDIEEDSQRFTSDPISRSRIHYDMEDSEVTFSSIQNIVIQPIGLP